MNKNHGAKLREEQRLMVFEKRVPREIFGAKRDNVIWDWKRPHNKELYDLCSPPNFIWVMKSRRMRWVGHVASMQERSGAYSVLVGRPKERHNLEDTCRNGKMTLKWILIKWDGGMDWIE
jgi:hypothetical protein